MPNVNPNLISLYAGILAALVQLFKDALSEEAKRWLPIAIVIFGSVAGALIAMYYGRDIVVGIFEGLTAGLSSLGLYSLGKSVVPSAINTKGWLKLRK